ncbi:MAG: hypothetical protein SFH39_06175 [Candidatus Magnetobacterium sp. LHC-1]|uniref:Addiction module component n=1 Tax=Candidatus Magnetobacterium casense TaxID=1455061 RepID=A0ABS6RUL7_9BACT|nr:hypothetical protein [Candidatus Magnetobacterium casensis]MBV6339968.1 hypothetical protein [Candidatus Magnetobacterium casensis]
MSTKEKDIMISFPLNIFEMVETKDALEDWLLSQNQEVIDRLLKARQDDIEGKGMDWKDLKEESGLK